MKKLILLLFCVIAFEVSASHIVGGEFEIRYIPGSNFRYDVRLILYFDGLFGEPNAMDQIINARIFRKHDNQLMENVQLHLYDTVNVEYFQKDCSNGSVVTLKLIYTLPLSGGVPSSKVMSSATYNHPEGYYIVWERCCRNYQITNIYSQQPEDGSDKDPEAAGQSFYLEFPPVVKDGKPFINSSPRLFPPLSDYGCPNQYYYIDFAGKDDDGDSLAYSIVTPMNTHQTVAFPQSGPAPFDSVRWKPGFSRTNVMMGNPDLRITQDGLLTVTPTRSGLFVFGVRCVEYRDGVKIGEVRRDFQMFVLDGLECPTPKPPVIEAKPKDAPDNAFVANNIQVNYAHDVSDENRCIQVRVSDADSQNPNDNKEENISIRVIPIGFKDPAVKEVLPIDTTAVLKDGSTAIFEICFPECPYLGGPFKLGIIAQDNACPLPRLDTIFVDVDINIPNNNPAIFQNDQVTATYLEGQATPTWLVKATDANLDSIRLRTPATDPYDIFDYGFTFEQTKDQLGLVEGLLRWDTRCDVVDFSDRTNFDFYFLANDNDFCDYTPADTMKFDLAIDLYDFHSPTISTEISPDSIINAKLFETIDFDVIGKDQDNDKVKLIARGLDFDFATSGISFTERSALGNVVSPAVWMLNCDNIPLDDQQEFRMQFIVVDEENRCHYYLADSINVKVKVSKPSNKNPELVVTGNKDAYTLGETISFELVGSDVDVSPTDKLKIELANADGTTPPQGYTLEADAPFGPNAKFSWTPGCEIFANDVYTNDYTFTFRVLDDRCYNEKDTALDVTFSIKDVERETVSFLPPNVISPNNDGKNDFFAMARRDDSGNLISILPNDNCTGTFVKFIIYNRWGTKVFETNDRDFKWSPEDDHGGVYFYTLKYSTFDYKGTIVLTF
ncbi:T9SS type B sorting domain-containing protein [Pseudochryseolinea flava]|uniref:Gliding motility-associated C-terminal domain-containing protein n=1 Tax=Pseudochryseolinea flava TaxID=2059302 RepID=A0A364Y6D7_9BACT|nr:gliding motility-associated C-terminal domain-containing protein [Pseudochryseolinea flava]RAW02621.1 hypothetical protein DQQ10_00475 [Pseudochryseolinea flava]